VLVTSRSNESFARLAGVYSLIIALIDVDRSENSSLR